jgi:Putative methyltransferase
MHDETGDAARSHWETWHDAYDDPGSSLGRRLIVVRRLITASLHAAPSGEIRVLSLCAGDGRDLLGVLEHHARRLDVRARLIETDGALIASGRRRVEQLGLADVTFVQGDAGDCATLGSPHNAQIVLACGIFGNICDDDIRTTVHGLAVLLKEGGSAIWTRHRRAPDLTPSIRSWFAEAGFEEAAFEPVVDSLASVGSHRLTAARSDERLPARLFEFQGDGAGGLV